MTGDLKRYEAIGANDGIVPGGTPVHDVMIVGAGPIGLALAANLGQAGLSVALIERQSRARLASPAFDGREIALTPESRALLGRLGAWQRLPATEIHSLAHARVLNGASPRSLAFHPPAGRGALGDLVPNFRIRAALHQVVERISAVRLLAGRTVVAVDRHAGQPEIRFDDGDTLRARLLIAADSRLSPLRAMVGITAAIHRLPKSMLTVRVAHDRPHHQIATEWFDHGRTIATLPLAPGESSVVLTVPHAEAQHWAEVPDDVLARAIAVWLGHRLGAVRIAGSRHVYPLVTSYADRFTAPQAALAGDAAVGMHPVTAHGFNLGLKGQEALARLVIAAFAAGGSEADLARALDRYARRHHLDTRPLYLATNAIVGLFTAETPRARLVRGAALHAAATVTQTRRRLSTAAGLLRRPR